MKSPPHHHRFINDVLEQQWYVTVGLVEAGRNAAHSGISGKHLMICRAKKFAS